METYEKEVAWNYVEIEKNDESGSLQKKRQLHGRLPFISQTINERRAIVDEYG